MKVICWLACALIIPSIFFIELYSIILNTSGRGRVLGLSICRQRYCIICIYLSLAVLDNLIKKFDRVQNMTSTEPWLSVEQIAAHLAISKETVYRWLEKGKIPAHRVGKQW